MLFIRYSTSHINDDSVIDATTTTTGTRVTQTRPTHTRSAEGGAVAITGAASTTTRWWLSRSVLPGSGSRRTTRGMYKINVQTLSLSAFARSHAISLAFMSSASCAAFVFGSVVPFLRCFPSACVEYVSHGVLK